MSEAQNLKTIQDGYAAFARGDVQWVLNDLADDVVWNATYGAGSHVPTAGERRGKAAVANWFKILAETVTFSSFEVREYVASGDKVIALGHYTGTPTGGTQFDTDFAAVYTLRNGKTTGLQEFANTAVINAAFPR